MIKRSALLTALALSVAAFGVSPLAANPLSRMLANSPFQPSDFDAMRAAEKTLYSRDGSTSGASVTWSNPETEARGTVKVTGQQGACLQLRHMAVPGGETAKRQIDRRFCKSANGDWLLSQRN
ncbi:hypothetical protein [Pseudophaeobacter sp.]|uniref:hypothetical protein n=1 Tax=Pseudophaeobacter sp. TaxID=1971739 RepID=UPI00405A327C